MNSKRNSHPQKNTLLKNAQANAASNFFKRVFFSPPLKFTLPFFTNLFSPPHGLTADTTSYASNVNRFEQSMCGLATTLLRMDRRATDNSGLAKAGVQFFVGQFFRIIEVRLFGESVVQKSPAYRQAAKRWQKP